MSVELRWRLEGTCDHGPKPIGAPRSECSHVLECDYGEIEYPDPRPQDNEIGHLVLVAGWWAGSLLDKAPMYDDRYGYVSVTGQDGRLFIHMSHAIGRWTWELFSCHFADGGDPDKFLLGVWPD